MSKIKKSEQPALDENKRDYESEINLLSFKLTQLKQQRVVFQAKPFKDHDEKLMLNALDIKIGFVLLDIQALKSEWDNNQ